MKKSFCSIRSFALIVLLTSVSWKLCGQSMPESSKPETDSLDVIAEYVRNSRAVLDSLTRLSDTRMQLTISKSSLKALQSQNTSLFADKIKAQTDANEMAVRLFDCNEAYAKKHKKWKAANFERWLWRAGVVVGIVIWVKPP